MNSAWLETTLRQVLLVPLVAVLLGAGALLWQMRQTEHAVAILRGSDFTLSEIQRVESLLVDEESGLRDFQATSNSGFLAPYTEAHKQLQPALSQLRLMSGAAEAASVDDLQITCDAWEQGFAVPLVASLRSGEQTSDSDLNLQGKALMDRMRQRLGGLRERVQQERAARFAAWESQVRRRAIALLLVMLVIALATGLYLKTLVQGLFLMFQRSQQALLAREKLTVAGRLAGTIAHEIHNPLDSISNLLFLMDGPSTNEENAQFLQLAREETHRVTQISRSMLSLYREAGAPVSIDLKEMLESILLLLAGRFSMLEVLTELDLPNDLQVHGFPAELRQVFTNLLCNALEASSPNATVYLSAARDPHHLDREGLRRQSGVIVSVEDEGLGIPEAIRSRLFQPFFSTKGEEGTGLGLWICQGILSKHGGEIEIISSTHAEHHGTTVNVFLPENPSFS